jgi:phospholipid transport system substrate-binding protein
MTHGGVAVEDRMKHGILTAGLIMLVVSAPSSWSASHSPLDAVRTTVSGVIDVLKARGADGAVDRERIGALIRDRFYFRGMAQSILGPGWRSASDEDQTRFVDLFSQMLIRLYMGRIEAYTNETVEYTKEDVQDNRATAETQIVTKDARIPIRYSLIEKDGQWLVYDVAIEGVSLIRNYRTSYREIHRNEGMNGLLTRIETKLKDLESGKQDPQP